MKRATFAVLSLPIAMVFAAALAVIAQPAERAFACSFPMLSEMWEPAEVVFEGRVLTAQPDPAASDESTTVLELRIQVAEGWRGVSDGDVLALQARLPVPGGVPLPCPGWASDQQFENKYLVAGVYGNSDVLILGRILTPFIGDEPAGEAYEEASRWARVVGRDSAQPSLQATLLTGGCPTTGTVVGERFTPNSIILLRHPGSLEDGGGHTPVSTGVDGSFRLSFSVPEGWCGFDGKVHTSVEAYPGRNDQQIGGFPLAYAILESDRTPIAPLPPDAGNSATPAGSSARLWTAVGVLALALLAVRRRATN